MRLAPPDQGGQDGGQAGGQAAQKTPDTVYAHAHSLFIARRYAEAEGVFQTFLSDYPKNPLAANAQFWVGECQYAQQAYDKAAKSYAIAYQNYPQSPKGADSLLKLGMSLNNMGKKTEACLTWGQLRKQFPNAGPNLTRADDEAKKAGCAG
jgi:tol-pal system protein YbgF